MKASLSILTGLLVVLIVGLWSSMFIVDQGTQALVLRLGAVADPDHPLLGPGLHWKWPFVENVVRYDARLLTVDPPAEQVILGDQKRIEIETYTRYQITDPLKFFQAVRTEDAVQARLREIVNDATRRILGTVPLPSVLSAQRDEIMHNILTSVAEAATPLGITVVDVRIRRADLPLETSRAIFDRMISERKREAAEARAQGDEGAQQIRATADHERTVILAEAQRQAQILRGEGDEEANRIYAAAYSADPQFFALYRSLSAYRLALGDGNTTYVLSPESDFFQFFNKPPNRH